MASKDNLYFAAKDAEELATILMSRENSWYSALRSNGYLDKIKRMWMAYHGAYDVGVSDGHQILFDGQQGELTKFNINHFRNLAQHMLVMVTSSRPALQCRATNTDYKSLVQTKLGNGLLDYYMREKRLEKYLRLACEYAIVLGSGYIKMTWNATSGEAYEYNEDTHTYVYEGDAEFTNLSPFDVLFDTSKENSDMDWIRCRTFKNKYDLMAKYPELAEEIQALPTKTDMYKYRLDIIDNQETDDVPVYEFFHRKTESMPEGRYLLYLSGTIVLADSPIPYRNLPIYRMSPSDILGTPYGYSPMFDILPIQEAINGLYSSVLTNNNAFAVQHIWLPRGGDLTSVQLSGGLNVIESQVKPEPIQLTASSPETYQFMKILEGVAETLSGISSTARGNPAEGVTSGNALALLQSMSLQFISGLQQSYVSLIEDTGTGLINLLKDNAAVPRIAAIVGKANRTYMKEFNGNDLQNINRVIVDVGNPLARSTAGRVQMAEQLLQMNVLTSPEQYFQVIESGKLDVLTDSVNDELLLIKTENEHMVEGQEVQALAVDKHLLHINEHKSVLSDPDLRRDPVLVAKVLEHIQEHINLMRTVDPALLQIIGEQALGPIGGTPPNVEPQSIPQSAMGGVPQLQNQPTSATTAATGQGSLPQPATPAGDFKDLPTNPAEMLPQ